MEAGDQGWNFSDKGSKIVIILDRASFHNKQEYLKKIETEMPNLH
jgi:hypothetical protein